MPINKKISATLSLLSMVVIVALTSMKHEDEGFKNIKVLPKKISHDELHKVMDEWEHSLGVHCDFCHAKDAATNKMDWASDAKPEKEMARDMYKMMGKINQKYFHAKKDSLGMIMEAGINCNSCHHGSAHPEIEVPAGGGHGMGPGMGGPPAPGMDKKQ